MDFIEWMFKICLSLPFLVLNHIPIMTEIKFFFISILRLWYLLNFLNTSTDIFQSEPWCQLKWSIFFWSLIIISVVVCRSGHVNTRSKVLYSIPLHFALLRSADTHFLLYVFYCVFKFFDVVIYSVMSWLIICWRKTGNPE